MAPPTFMIRYRSRLSRLLVCGVLLAAMMAASPPTRAGDKMCRVDSAHRSTATDEATDTEDADCVDPAWAVQRQQLLADHFYRRGMYFRAIGAYEEVALFSGDPKTVVDARLRIAMAFHHGNQFEQAASTYDEVLREFELPANLAGMVRLQRIVALAELDQKLPRSQQRGILRGELEPLTRHQGRDYQLPSQYQMVRLHLLYGDYAKAKEQFDTFATRCNASFQPTCRKLDDLDVAVSLEPPESRSPALGAALSAVVPGAGAVYAGHHIDALYYLGMTGLGAWVSLELHESGGGLGDQSAAFYTTGTLTLLVYASNILQGYFGVRRYNTVADHEYRQRVLSKTAAPLPLDR